MYLIQIELPDANNFANSIQEQVLEEYGNVALALTGILVFVYFVRAFTR